MSKTKVQECKLSLKSQNKATEVLDTNFLTLVKSFLKKKKNWTSAFDFLPYYVCRRNAFIWRGFAEGHTACKLFQGCSISTGAMCGELGTNGFILKILGNKNPTCKNLSGALVLWHFIKMLAMKSEPIFWLSRNYKI